MRFGFLWYIEDSDFRVFNEESGAFHSWISCRMMVSNNLTLNFKVSNTKQFTSTTINSEDIIFTNDVFNKPQFKFQAINFRALLDNDKMRFKSKNSFKMKLFNILFVSVIALCSGNYCKIKNSDLDEFNNFVEKYNKIYYSPNEYFLRFNV